jgi:hypothetical protein
MAISIHQNVSVMPIFDLQQICDNGVACHELMLLVEFLRSPAKDLMKFR